MLLDEGGRFQTVQTDEDFLTIFQSEFNALQPLEQELALTAFTDYLQGVKSPIIELASQSLYREPPVTMEQFVNDPYFLGQGVCKSLYPKVKQELCEIFSGQYTRAIIGGALGLGKTTSGSIGILRMVYEASCLWEPHETYGMSPTDFIMFPCISSTEEVAERNILNKIRSIIEDSPYFNHEYRPEKNSIGHGILFPNKILIPPGASTVGQVLGGNVLGMFLDESNFFPKRTIQDRSGDSKENIEMIYESIKRRMESRFIKRGKLPGIIIIASSKTSHDSFTERVIQKSVNDPRVYISERSVWEVFPPERYSGKKFKVAIGNETRMSRILVEGEADPEAMKVIEVPIEFYGAFESDVENSIRDFGGYSTVAITPFIARREKIYECIDKDRTHPFNTETWDQGFPGVVDWAKICRLRNDGAWEPLHYPTIPRHVHLDLSKNHDKTGFSVGCISGYTPVQRFGEECEELAPMIHADFTLQIRAPMAGEIVYAEIRKLIYDFSQHGFYIKLVSADQFQCFTGETKIRLLYGESKTFEQLSHEYKDKPLESIWVYSFDGRRIVPGRAFHPRKTGKKKVIQVELDHGHKIKCTLDHKWMKRDGTWIKAQDLKSGEILMSLSSFQIHKVISVIECGEEDVYDISVEKYHNFALDAGVIVHNSLSLLQTMKSQGYNTKVISVEPAGGPYELLKQAIYETRVSMYHYPPLIKELRELQKNWKTGKVDHPDSSRGGSKDVSDALASIISSLTHNHKSVLEQPISKGAQIMSDQDDKDSWITDGQHVTSPMDADDDSGPEWRRQAEVALSESPVRKPAWRESAEKMMDEQPGAPTHDDWKKNFSMPFLLG